MESEGKRLLRFVSGEDIFVRRVDVGRKFFVVEGVWLA